MNLARPCLRRTPCLRRIYSVFHNTDRGPWSFVNPNGESASKPTAVPTTIGLHRDVEEITKLSEEGQVVKTLSRVIKLKNRGHKPNIDIYNALLRAFAIAGLPNEARAIFDDMIMMRIDPTAESLECLLRAERFSDTKVIYDVLAETEKLGIEPNDGAFHHIIARHALEEQLEMCFRWLTEIATRGVVPQLSTVHKVVTLASSLGYPRLALDIAKSFEAQGVRRLDTETWMECLAGCAHALYADGVTECWEQVVTKRRVFPDEGLFIQVLHTAARHGLSKFASQALTSASEHLPHMKLRLHHFEPALEAACLERNLDEAISILQQMTNHRLVMDRHVLTPLSRMLAYRTETLDEAWTKLEQNHKAGVRIDTNVFNAVIQAAVHLADFPHAMGLLRSAPDLGLTPNLDTFSILLSGAVAAKDLDMGRTLISNMKKEGLNPDEELCFLILRLFVSFGTLDEASQHLSEYMSDMESWGSYASTGLMFDLQRRAREMDDARWERFAEVLLERNPRVVVRSGEFLDRDSLLVEVGGRRRSNRVYPSPNTAT